MYKVFYITFGCKVNQYETECISNQFYECGYISAKTEQDAKIFIVNSCTVTRNGYNKSIYAVRRLRRNYPDSVIVLTGCLPQTSCDITARCPEADILTGTKNRSELPELVKCVLNAKKRICIITAYDTHDKFEDLPCRADLQNIEKTRVFLKIQDGCNCFCSYCIIPFARGHCRSKPLKSLVADVQKLADAGCKEIVLVGINIAFYGKEFSIRLVDAVEACAEINGIERIRLGSLNPEMISDDDIRRFSKILKFCPQFHLSLQSGSIETLQRMNRKYTPDEYRKIVMKIRDVFHNASFTTDIMVGFPGETEKEFVESLTFVDEIGFSKIHVFQYSPREGTVASKMSQLSKSIKSERANKMKTLGEKMSEKYLASLVGKTVTVLFERENSNTFHQGRAPDHTLVKIPRKNSKKSLRNLIFYVLIKEPRSNYCLGQILNRKWK